MVAVAAGLALAAGAQADTVVQNFSQTFALTASPTGATPAINTTWNVAQYNGFGGLTSLTAVQYDVSTQIFYRGVLIAIGTGKTFNLEVRSDFNFDLPTSTADVTNLDPTISLSGTSPGTTLTTFQAPVGGGTASSTANSATRLASDLATYVGGGTVAVPVTGSLLTTASGGSYHNNSDLGPTSPYVFVDNAKVFPVFGLQEYSLVATLTVTYTVPEPGTYAAIAAVALLVGRQWAARRRTR